MVKERQRWSSAAGRVGLKWLQHVSAAHWLAEYQAAWLRGDVMGGVTLDGFLRELL
jgi:hypothetical protein